MSPRHALIATFACALAVLALGIGANRAAADADPASDVLYGASVFYPYSAPTPRPLARALDAETAGASRAGFPIKVALIGRPVDLGGIPELFGSPARYAKFLDSEISFGNKPVPLLVIMPAGVAGSGLGARATAVLATLSHPISGQPTALAQAAIADIPKLAAAAGHPILVRTGTIPAAGRGGLGTAVILTIAAAVALALALAVTWLRHRSARR